jgi:ATP-dependent DNA helicase RecQ
LTPHAILKQYWGYDTFRHPQEQIIQSVLDGKDTLGLMPTGGGKSLCFQVPALLMDGVCIVVSPLIALMKDQAENLKRRGIAAEAIYSGMPPRQVALVLNNCLSGAVKFLYLSPERLKSQMVTDFIRNMHICLFAVDEAHCISQWGFDFRPEYRQIADVREHFPSVPVLALTASATAHVVKDIMQQLRFRKEQVFRLSFARKNLSYVVRACEDKNGQMLHIISNVQGSGLVYVRNRKKTEAISRQLKENGVVADYYHAGLTAAERAARQDAWINDRTRIMVCTNAFGMGIDKPDCRLVVHYELPDGLESYYQEAGRAGRDGKRSYCVLLYHPADAADLQERYATAFPPEKEIRRVYHALCNYYHVPVGNNVDQSFDFDVFAFCAKYGFKPMIAHSALKILEQCDLVSLTESFYEPSKLRITTTQDNLYKYRVEHASDDELLKLLLRTYGGLFDHYVSIQEKMLAAKSNTTVDDIRKALARLQRQQVVDYAEQKEQAQLSFLSERVDESYISFERALLKTRREVFRQKLDGMLAYAANETVCRSRAILEYFDEFGAIDCGTCDVCIERQKRLLNSDRAQYIEDAVRHALNEKPLPVKELAHVLGTIHTDDLTLVIRLLLDKGKLHFDSNHYLYWK